MKKLLVVFLALALVFSAPAILPAAKNSTNVQRDIDYIDEAPVIDGEIEDGEYGTFPLDTWELGDEFDESEPIFYTGNGYDITDDDLSILFYATWDRDYLYLAWEVYTKYDSRLPFDEEAGYMYEYCCIQFMVTPGAPDNTKTKYQTDAWGGNYAELGLCLRDDGNSCKVCWNVPSGAGISDRDWTFVGSRDDRSQLTTYECRLPWKALGWTRKPTGGEQFGLNFGVCAQENYYDGMGLVEYVDGIFHGKDADNAVCFTLTGYDDEILPDESEDASLVTGRPGVDGGRIDINYLNQPITDGTKSLITAGNVNEYNPKWATTLLLRPLSDVYDVDGHYQVVDIVQGQGTEISFRTTVMPGDIALITHSSGDGYPGHEDRQALASLDPGESQVYIFGYHTVDGNTELRYSNPMVIILPVDEYIDYFPDDEPDWSYDESYVEPDWSYDESYEEPDWSYDESYDEPEWSGDADWSSECSHLESAAGSGDSPILGETDDDDDQDDEDDDRKTSRKKKADGDNIILVIVIVAGAVLFVAADVVVIILLKKRQ